MEVFLISYHNSFNSDFNSSNPANKELTSTETLIFFTLNTSIVRKKRIDENNFEIGY